MKNYYWQRKEVGASVPHILGLTASPVMGSNIDDLETLESILDAKCKTPQKQKADLALHVKLPTLVKIQFNGDDAITNPQRRTPTMVKLSAAHASLNFRNDPEIVRLRATDTEASRRKLEKVVLARNTFIQTQMKSFIRTSVEVHRGLGGWAADAYICQATSSFIKCTDSNSLGWENAEKEYLANSLRCLGSTSDTTSILSKDAISNKARALIQFLGSCDKTTIGIIFAKERSMAYMLYRLISEHPDTRNLFCLGTIVGMSRRPVGKRDIFEFSHHEMQSQTLEKFRTGEINLLIATSVVEEGIDVPRCNLVICFNEPDNLKSFIQRRGRARLRESKLVMLLEKNSKSRMAGWKELEQQMKLQYGKEERSAPALTKLEEDEMEQRKCRKFRVQSTGALLDIDTAKSHLEYFCSRLSSHPAVHLKPEYIVLGGDQEDGQGEPLLVRAKVVLPVTLDPKLRVHVSRDLWRSEKNATKDAAFEAYVALYHAGLVNDNLLPLFTERSRYMDKEDSLIEVQQQFNPWPRVAWAWENKEKLQRRVLTVIDEAGSMKCQIEMLIPADIHDIKPILIYFSSSSEWKIEVGPAKTIPHSLLTVDDTTALLSLSYGHRWEVEQLRHIALFKAVDVDIRSFSIEDLSIISTDCRNDTIGLLRDPQNHSHPYLFHKWLSAKPPLKSIQRPHKDHESFSQEQPFVAVKKWSQRSDFLHPIAPDFAMKEKSSAEYFTVFPRSLLMMDTVPIEFSQFGLLVPSLLHNIEVQLLVGELCATVLSEIKSPDFELIRTAISAPVARERDNYQKLEFLGDSILKFLTSIFVSSKC